MPATGDVLELIRAALAGRPAWLVGGAVRDRLLGRDTQDYDVVLDGDPRTAARAIAGAAGRAAIGRATAFALSEEYGGWRVVARDGSWQIDVERLRGDSLEEDLALRDFTVNAIAEPLGEPGTRADSGSGFGAGVDSRAGVGTGSGAGAGGRARAGAGSGAAVVDPLGGVGDLTQRCLRVAGPRAFAEDPLRVLRLVRLAVELDFEPDAATRALARTHAEGLRAVAGERVFMELCRILDTPSAVHGLELMGEVGATPVVLPEVAALQDVEQSRFHHLDVYDHTLEALAQTIALQEDPAVLIGRERGRELAGLLCEPLADGLTRGGALRWGALLHDAAKPLTREVRPADGRVTFVGHDTLGAQLAGEVLARLRASARLQAHVAALVRHHLRLGFLVHKPQPLTRRSVYTYLRACEPVEVDVTVLSVADRMATRGDRARESIDAHLCLARTMLLDALAWRADGPPQPLVRGDELAHELGVPAGPRLGELLEELAAARYAGEIATRAQALDYARRLLASAAPELG